MKPIRIRMWLRRNIRHRCKWIEVSGMVFRMRRQARLPETAEGPMVLIV